MSDTGGVSPHWIVTAVVAVASALSGAYGSVILARRRVRIEERQAGVEENKTLSQSEAEFRREIMNEIRQIKGDLKHCEEERLQCREREVETHALIEKLRDEIQDLKARMPQRELPLEKHP